MKGEGFDSYLPATGLIRYETNPKNAGFTGKSLKVTVDGSEIR